MNIFATIKHCARAEHLSFKCPFFANASKLLLFIDILKRPPFMVFIISVYMV